MKNAFGVFWLAVLIALVVVVAYIIRPSISLWQEAVTRVSKPAPPAPEKSTVAPESSLPIGAMGGPELGPQPSEVADAIARLEKALGETKKAEELPKEPPPKLPPKEEEAKKPPGKKVPAMPMSSASALEGHLRMVFESQQNYQRRQFEAYLAQKEHLATEKLKRELWVLKSEVVTYEEARKTFKNLPPRDHSYWEQYQRAKKEWERTHFPSDHEKTLAVKEIERKKALAEAAVRSQSTGQGQVSFRTLVPNPLRQKEYERELEKLKESIEAERIAFGHRLSRDYALFERQLQLMRQAPQRPQGARLY